MYYHGSSDIQGDGLQTLYLMNPNYEHSNMVLMNSSSAMMPHAPLPQFVGIPLSHDPSDIQATIPRFQYNLWGGLADKTQQRGLSLTLSAHQTKPISGDQDFPASPSLTVTESIGVNTMRSVLIGSKYLKAAQELLDEVANAGKHEKTDRPKDKVKMIEDSILTNKDAGGELTTAQRQEIQMKKAKLNSMLDEVEQRYRHYHNQMQIVVASFEQAAGTGSARTYTQLALKTILKQFKCLKSTISAQLKGLNKSLGEEESVEKKLKFVDRQQRAMQQLGMMQNNAWRPQRGLPERAVSVLRAWLFEHFLHPYPKDSDKQMLAKQTGLTRSQVSNWFINARVRLWKPMVEEMYQEETKNQEKQNSGDIARQENNTKTARMDPSPTEISASTESSLQAPTGFAQLINLPEKHPKKSRNGTLDNSSSTILSAEMEIKNKDFNGQTTENYLSMAATNINRYGISELNRFNTNQQLAAGFQGNNFSLTLGLPPAETSQGAHHQNFLSHRNFEFQSGALQTARINQPAASHPNNIAYEILDFQNRKPFPAQLLPDFVA